MKNNFVVLLSVLVFLNLISVHHANAVVTSTPNLNNGYVLTDIDGAINVGHRVAIDEAGKITVVATTTYASAGVNPSRIDLIRYNSDGSLDTSFGSNGVLETALVPTTATDIYPSLAMQTNGKIVIAVGYVDGGKKTVITRFNTNGTTDTTFGSAGVVHENRFGSRSVVLQPDGNILITGDGMEFDQANCPSEYTYGCSNTTFGVAKLTTNGSYDNSFGVQGIVIGDPIKNIRYSYGCRQCPYFSVEGTIAPHAITTIRDDSFVLTATVSYPQGQNWLTSRIVKYLSDGTKDATFGTDGTYDFSISTEIQSSQLFSLISTVDNKIVGCGQGRATYEDPKTFFLTKVNADGSLDQSFGNNGLLYSTFDSEAVCFGLAQQTDGKIISIGGTTHGAALTRHNSNGTIDTSFGSNGFVNLSISQGDSAIFNGVFQNDGKLNVVGYSVSDILIVKLNSTGKIAADPSLDSNLVTINLTKLWPRTSAVGVQLYEPVISVTPQPSQSICVGEDGSQCYYSYPKNATVRMSVSGNYPIRFLGWDDDCAGFSTSCTLSLTENKQVTATFLEDKASDPTKPVLRDAIYMYEQPIYGISEKQINGHNCDILELVLDVTSGFSDLTMMAPVSQGNGSEYPDSIDSNAAMFVYALYGNTAEKRFSLRSNKAKSDEQIGNATFFGYCYSTQSNATVDMFDTKTGTTHFSNGTTR